MRRLLYLGVASILVLALSGCGGGDRSRRISGPGFVGIDDSVSDSAPLLTVDYVDSVLGPGRALILSDPLSDGDIAFDPVQSVFTVTTNVDTLFFGEDSFDRNLPEFRAFLTFPLDGSTGQDIVPLGATITNATVEFFVTEVSFAGIVPTFLDLIQYGFQSLLVQDFRAPVIDFRTLDFFSSDEGNFVLIEITPLVQTAQDLALLDFQIRLSLDDGVSTAGATMARPQAARQKAKRTVSPSSIAGKRPERRSQAGGSRAGAGAERPTRSR
jgi:hypothetical protein